MFYDPLIDVLRIESFSVLGLGIFQMNFSLPACFHRGVSRSPIIVLTPYFCLFGFVWVVEFRFFLLTPYFAFFFVVDLLANYSNKTNNHPNIHSQTLLLHFSFFT